MCNIPIHSPHNLYPYIVYIYILLFRYLLYNYHNPKLSTSNIHMFHLEIFHNHPYIRHILIFSLFLYLNNSKDNFLHNDIDYTRNLLNYRFHKFLLMFLYIHPCIHFHIKSYYSFLMKNYIHLYIRAFQYKYYYKDNNAYYLE